MGHLRSLCFLSIWAAVGVAQELPQLEIDIAPVFNDSSVEYLDVKLRIQDPKASTNRTLVYFEVNKPHLTPEQRYDGNGLTATDDQGALPITYTDVNGWQRNWVPSREPVGEITISFSAEPRGEVAGVAGRNDLRFDQGGAMGQGFSFIPYPPLEENWDMVVKWEIPESAPAGTHFASSLGDVESSSATGYPVQVLHNTYFAIGQLQRYPAWEDSTKMLHRARQENKPKFSTYWIGELPWDISALAPRTEEIYDGTASYFSDFESDFRVFYRRDYAAFGGAGGFKSFLMEYTEGSEIENPQESIGNLISHEIIHGFAKTYPGADIDKWYSEGIAEYLGALAPFVGGGLNRTTFVQWINDNAQDYYTASPLGRTWESMIVNYWTQGTAVVKAPYTRGFMYLAYVQGLIATATNDEKSLNDIILEMYQMYLDRKQVRTQEFLALLGDIIGAEAAQASYDAMASGTTLVPAPEGFASYGLKMVRRDLERFSLGMSENSLGQRQVVGLLAGSRAEEAGLKEGDVLTSVWGLWGSSDTFESQFQVTMNVNGTEKVVEWWPRAYEKVEAWEWVDIDA